MRGPLDEVCIHEAPCCLFGINFHEHVGVGVVAGGRHHIVLRAIGVTVVDPLVLVAGDDELNGLLIFEQQRIETVVGKLRGFVEIERIVDEDEGRLVMLQLGFEPVELVFTERAAAGVEVGSGVVLRAAEEIIQVDEFVALVVQDGVRLRIELSFEEAMAHLAGDAVHIVVMVAEAEVYGHVEAVGDGFGVVETGGVFEVEVVVGGGVVVEVVADEEDLLDGGVERVDEVARGGVAGRGEENAFVVLDAVFAAFDVEVVDDVRVGNKRKVELVR